MFFETFLHKFYAASISITLDGGLLVSSTRTRMMAWGMVFCFVAALSLISYLVWRKKHNRTLSLSILSLSLLIPVFIMPSVKHEYIHVTPEQLTIDTGTWYRPSFTQLEIPHKGLIQENINGILPSNLIGDPKVNWHITAENGDQKILELNPFFNAHRMVVAHYIRDRGYRVELLEDKKQTRL